MFHVIAWQTKARQVRRRLRFLPNGCIQLSREGLKYPGDYEFVLAGVHATRWAALQAGEIDCAPQPAPWNFIAENAGYNLIGEINDVIPEVLFAALIAKKVGSK